MVIASQPAKAAGIASRILPQTPTQTSQINTFGPAPLSRIHRSKIDGAVFPDPPMEVFALHIFWNSSKGYMCVSSDGDFVTELFEQRIGSSFLWLDRNHNIQYRLRRLKVSG
jgi:hypothetical protein